jgi:hypothetical protein
MDAIQWPDVFARAAKTFVQIFVTSMPVGALLALDVTAAKAAALSAAGAALALLWNAALQWSTA